jgi:hypothetical protein
MDPVFGGIEDRAIQDLEILNGPLSSPIGVITFGD